CGCCCLAFGCLSVFFFQAEAGIRDRNVTGVQTCALPIFGVCHDCLATIDGRTSQRTCLVEVADGMEISTGRTEPYGEPPSRRGEIGRASCRERGSTPVVAAPGKNTQPQPQATTPTQRRQP